MNVPVSATMIDEQRDKKPTAENIRAILSKTVTAKNKSGVGAGKEVNNRGGFQNSAGTSP
jgi:hypothetical protein